MENCGLVLFVLFTIADGDGSNFVTIEDKLKTTVKSMVFIVETQKSREKRFRSVDDQTTNCYQADGKEFHKF